MQQYLLQVERQEGRRAKAKFVDVGVKREALWAIVTMNHTRLNWTKDSIHDLRRVELIYGRKSMNKMTIQKRRHTRASILHSSISSSGWQSKIE